MLKKNREKGMDKKSLKAKSIHIRLTLILSINIINITSRKNMRRETSDSHLLTGVPSLSKLSKKYFTDSPCEDDKEQRESVRLSKHCELTIKTAEHKLDIQTAVQKVNDLPFFILMYLDLYTPPKYVIWCSWQKGYYSWMFSNKPGNLRTCKMCRHKHSM